jgi:predicted nucleic acid-binding protein
VRPARARRAPATRERGPQYIAPGTEPVAADASVASCGSPTSRIGGERLLASDRALFAPDLMAVEVANAWSKKMRRSEMHLTDVEQAVTHLLSLGIAWSPSATLVRPATRMAADLGHPVYDCLYLAPAAARSVPLATADDRLRSAARRLGIGIWA